MSNLKKIQKPKINANLDIISTLDELLQLIEDDEKIYDKLIEIGGAGATIPLPSFGNSLADAAIKGVKEDGLLGAFTGGIKGAAGGITASIFFGYLMALIFNPKTKK